MDAAHPRPLATPLMVVDLDAFDANARDLARRAGGKPIRVASKSLRVPALIARALAAPGFHGVLGYTLREALWLERQQVSDDIVIAYPTVDRAALAELVTVGPGYPTRAELVATWEVATGRQAGDLSWFVTLAVWKLAVLLEASYHRHLVGSTDDPFFATLEQGVPALLAHARETCGA